VCRRRPKRGSEDEAIGRSRGGLSTKVNIGVDALGNPIRFILTPGQVHDICQAEGLISGLPFENLLADKGYDSDKAIPEAPQLAAGGLHQKMQAIAVGQSHRFVSGDSLDDSELGERHAGYVSYRPCKTYPQMYPFLRVLSCFGESRHVQLDER
jgi:hypothetical protein